MNLAGLRHRERARTRYWMPVVLRVLHSLQRPFAAGSDASIDCMRSISVI